MLDPACTKRLLRAWSGASSLGRVGTVAEARARVLCWCKRSHVAGSPSASAAGAGRLTPADADSADPGRCAGLSCCAVVPIAWADGLALCAGTRSGSARPACPAAASLNDLGVLHPLKPSGSNDAAGSTRRTARFSPACGEPCGTLPPSLVACIAALVRRRHLWPPVTPPQQQHPSITPRHEGRPLATEPARALRQGAPAHVPRPRCPGGPGGARGPPHLPPVQSPVPTVWCSWRSCPSPRAPAS